MAAFRDTPDHHALALWAADCAEHVLHLFEVQHPADQRPRLAIEAARAWSRGHLPMTQARTAAFAAHAAARGASTPAACAAARSAGHAAATPHVPTHAPHAAAYALKAATESGSDHNEREWQEVRLPQHLRPTTIHQKHNG